MDSLKVEPLWHRIGELVDRLVQQGITLLLREPGSERSSGRPASIRVAS